MAKKISQLTQATEVKSDDVTVIVQDGETKKLPLNMMVTKQDIENKKIAGLAKLDEIEATYENDTYTPTITVKNKSSVKTGEGDEVDYSANVMDGHAKSAILSGSTKYRDIDTGEFLETFEEGRNLELVSVKMPVLKTYNDNPVPSNIELTRGAHYSPNMSSDKTNGFKTDYIYYPNKVNEGEQEITLYMGMSYDGEESGHNISCYRIFTFDKDKNHIETSGFNGNRTKFKSDFEYIQLSFLNHDSTFNIDLDKVSNIWVNTENVGYAEHKSNILTVNEDVTLRSNGDICDELNLLTGQLTQRIGEDGVVLSQEVVKTVDLMPSGTHPSTTPYCWKNGHIQLSSSGLLPSLEYSVVTSRAGQINQNATMIVKNDKRIFDLEILLAGGLVNTTYQALTLQNQVETGLSKVSLNSETEPDYLLYHMIMKLIEEKAYKLDDLTEKVSVFYLYEKLSDEQFETIYSALYPFVEDEIVEEPVVEELPEVVEDEVIM